MSTLGKIDTFFDDDSGETFVRSRRRGEHLEGEWECTVCGHIRVGNKPPDMCPECGADADEFEFWEFEDDWEDYD